jgi:hypothetical protein
MKKVDEFCEMSTFTLFMNVVSSLMINVMCLFFIKLLVQVIIQFDISLLRRFCISSSRDIWWYAFATFMFSSLIILFLLMFQIVWICSIKNFNVVSQILFRRFFICVAKSISWIFANVLILRAMINLNVMSIVFKNAMNLYVLKFM